MQLAPTFTPNKPKYFLVTADWIYPIIIIFLTLFLLWLALFSPVFAIQNLRCELDARPCPDSSLLAEVNRIRGSNIFRFDSHTFSSRLTSADFTVRDATINKILPNTLVVELSSVYPSVALRLAEATEWIILDDRLRVIRSVTFDPNVPTVIVPGPLSLKVGEVPSDPELSSALTFARTVISDLPHIATISLSPHTLTLSFTDQPYVALLSTTSDLTPQIRSLQAILSGATIDSSTRVIDVRFAQPVLK